MSPEEASALKREVAELRQILNFFVRTTDYTFKRPIKGGTDGLRVGLNAKDKLGFYGATPIVQFSDGSGRQDIHDNSGAAMQIGTRFTGNTGTAYYGFGDIVYWLKTIGLIQT